MSKTIAHNSECNKIALQIWLKFNSLTYSCLLIKIFYVCQDLLSNHLAVQTFPFLGGNFTLYVNIVYVVYVNINKGVFSVTQ